MRDDNCIFCKIANGDIPSKAIYEDDLFKVILDLGPATRGHALILPKDHAKNLFELPDDTVLLPGHMDISTVGEEKRGNPFV